MPIYHKRFSEQSEAEWEATRRALLAPGLIYWVLLPVILIGATVRVIMGLVGPEAADWQDWGALALLIVLWAMFIRAVWQRRALWQKRGPAEAEEAQESEPQRSPSPQRSRREEERITRGQKRRKG